MTFGSCTQYFLPLALTSTEPWGFCVNTAVPLWAVLWVLPLTDVHILCICIDTKKQPSMKVWSVRVVTDGQVVRAGVSVTWYVLSWAGGHEFEPRSGQTWGAWYFCPKSYLNQNITVNLNLLTCLTLELHFDQFYGCCWYSLYGCSETSR